MMYNRAKPSSYKRIIRDSKSSKSNLHLEGEFMQIFGIEAFDAEN